MAKVCCYAIRRSSAARSYIMRGSTSVFVLLTLLVLVAHPVCANPVAEENRRQGVTRSRWDVDGALDENVIAAYASSTSVSAGDELRLHIRCPSASPQSPAVIEVYRLGYYGGDGARFVGEGQVITQFPLEQPESPEAWRVSATWTVPSDAVSGVYVARIAQVAPAAGPVEVPPHIQTNHEARQHQQAADERNAQFHRLEQPTATQVLFIVRANDRGGDILLQLSDATWAAMGEAAPEQTTFSLDAPQRARRVSPHANFFALEYPVIRFLERFGYNVQYIAGSDVDRAAEQRAVEGLARGYRVFATAGLDLFWSDGQRAAIEAMRSDFGLQLAFFGHGAAPWRMRWTGNSRRRFVAYRENHDGPSKRDPEDWTGSWRDARSINPLGAAPENAVSGTMFTHMPWHATSITVPWTMARLRQWAHTKVAKLGPGMRAVLHHAAIGRFASEDVVNEARPVGIVKLSDTELDWTLRVARTDRFDGSPFRETSGVRHHLTLFDSRTGHGEKALTFTAGSEQFGWALDDTHDVASDSIHFFAGSSPRRVHLETAVLGPEPALQQLVLNVLGMMSVAPASVPPPLVVPALSTQFNPDVVPHCSVVAVEARGSSLRVVIDAWTDARADATVADVEAKHSSGSQWLPAKVVVPKTDDARTAHQLGRQTWAVTLPRRQNSDGATSPSDFYCRATDDALRTSHEFVRAASDRPPHTGLNGARDAAPDEL